MKQHKTTITLIQNDALTSYLVRDYFNLPRKEALMSALLSRQLGQADLVLCLLRLRDKSRNDWHRVFTHYINRLVGHPIFIGQPCLLRYRINGQAPTIQRRGGDRRIVWVLPANPRQPFTQAHLRWSEFRVGRSISQLRLRGHKRRDIYHAIEKGWIKVES
jgi:hypothetical protein